MTRNLVIVVLSILHCDLLLIIRTHNISLLIIDINDIWQNIISQLKEEKNKKKLIRKTF